MFIHQLSTDEASARNQAQGLTQLSGSKLMSSVAQHHLTDLHSKCFNATSVIMKMCLCRGVRDGRVWERHRGGRASRSVSSSPSLGVGLSVLASWSATMTMASALALNGSDPLVHMEELAVEFNN